jgi:hypothetical protein
MEMFLTIAPVAQLALCIGEEFGLISPGRIAYAWQRTCSCIKIKRFRRSLLAIVGSASIKDFARITGDWDANQADGERGWP